MLLAGEHPLARAQVVEHQGRQAGHQRKPQVHGQLAQHDGALACVHAHGVFQQEIARQPLLAVDGHEQGLVAVAVDQAIALARILLQGRLQFLAVDDLVGHAAGLAGGVEQLALAVQDAHLEALVEQGLRALEHVLDAVIAVDALSVADAGLHFGDHLPAQGGVIALFDFAVVLVKAQVAHQRQQRQRDAQKQAENRDDQVGSFAQFAHVFSPPVQLSVALEWMVSQDRSISKLGRKPIALAVSRLMLI